MHVHQGDGRSYLARHDTRYDLVWYVAPDSYAATNAASSGAFVLSESYLYTKEMIKTTMEHLNRDGIMVVQFGELDFRTSPNRTSRVATSSGVSPTWPRSGIIARFDFQPRRVHTGARRSSAVWMMRRSLRK